MSQKSIGLFFLIFFLSAHAGAQGLNACMSMDQKKNPGVNDPIDDLLTSDFQCSIPDWAPHIFVMRDDPKQIFHAPCVLHDLCYKHGSYSYKKTRKNCDDEFKDKTDKTCKVRYPDQSQGDSQLRCLTDSNTLYQIVRQVGFAFFLSPPGFNDFPQGVQPFVNDHGRVCRYLD